MHNDDIYMQVAKLHIANICHGFLSTLGIGFLSLMYETIDRNTQSVLLVSKEDNRIVGFVAGTSNMRSIYRQMLCSWFRLFLYLCPILFSPKKIWRIIEILRYSSNHDNDLPTAELLSIVVDQDYRGTKCAENLYQRLTEHFLKRGFTSFKIVVGASLVIAQRFYNRMGAVQALDIEVHNNQKSFVYIHYLRVD